MDYSHALEDTGSRGGLAYRGSRRETAVAAGICFDGGGVGAVDDHSNVGLYSVICGTFCALVGKFGLS